MLEIYWVKLWNLDDADKINMDIQNLALCSN